MTIFIPEYFIYWSSCPNFFFMEYTPAYVFIVDTLFFDFDNYTVLYKTGAFNKEGYPKFAKWIHNNFYKARGRSILRCYLFEKYLCLKKFGFQKKLLFYGLKGYHNCYQWDIIAYQYSTFGFLDWIKDKPIYGEAGNWFNWYMHPRKWRMIARYSHKYKVKLELDEGTVYDTVFDSWDGLYLFSMGGLAKQYWVILSKFWLYNFYNKDWFEDIYIFNFFKGCEFWLFFVLYRSFLPIILEIYISYLNLILLIPIYCYLIFLFYHFIYDTCFILFIYNRFIIKLMLEVYYLLIGYYLNVIFWFSSIRMFKNKFLNDKNYDLNSLLKFKQYALRNYCYKLFLNENISEKEEKKFLKIDDGVEYPFFLIYLFKYKFEIFIFLERFFINLSYFFDKYFFINLLKKYYLRNAISFLNFIIILIVFIPIFVILNIIYNILYTTSFIEFFFKDRIYEYFNMSRFETYYEDILTNKLFDKILEEKYDYFIYWYHIKKFEHFTLSYYQQDRERVHRYYTELLEKERSERDVPIEEIIFEYWNERQKFNIGTCAYGKSRGHKSFFNLNRLVGNYIKNKMYLHDPYNDDPFFFGQIISYLSYGFFFKKIFWITFILNFLQINYFNNIIKNLKLISNFWQYYFYIILFYPVYHIFNVIEWIHLMLLSLTWESYILIICKLYLHFVIIRKLLLRFWIVVKFVNIFKILYKYFKIFMIKLKIFIGNFRIPLPFKFWKFLLLFYFYFLRYKFILKIFKIFLVRMWIIWLSLVILILFIDEKSIILESSSLTNMLSFFWETFLNQYLNPEFSLYIVLKENFMIFWWFEEIYLLREYDYFFFRWQKYIIEWVFLLQNAYNAYTPHVHWSLKWSQTILKWLFLDDRWWLFHARLWFEMDYGFMHIHNMLAILKFPTFYHVWRNFYHILIFSYIYFFFDWFYHYFIYSFIYLIDVWLNFIYLNELLIFIINIFYNITIIIQYYFYFFLFYYIKVYYDQLFIDWMSFYSINVFPYLKHKIVRAYCIADFLLVLEYYWLYVYHYLFYHSYQIIHELYNFLIYLRNAFFWKTWQYSYTPYNILGAYDAFNSAVTMPLLVFFNKFFMYFLDSNLNLHYYMGDYPTIDFPMQFPFAEPKKQLYAGSTTLNRFFLQTWIIKVNILEHYFLYGWRYNTRFSSTLFLLSYFYVVIIFYCFVRILIYSSKSFRQMNSKQRISQSGSRIWYGMRPLESRHLYTELEYDWVYSWDWIYEFPLYREEFFPYDPLTDVRNKKEINYFEGNWVVYRFLTKLFEYKEYQNNYYLGWRILNKMDKYYKTRYQQVLNAVDTIYKENVTGVERQTKIFLDMDIKFEMGYYIAENDKNWRLYEGYKDRYEGFKDIATYENFLFKVVMPFMYYYCDDPKYINYYTKNIGKMRENLWKFETLLNDQEKHGLNFIEFYFTDKQFYDKFFDEFSSQDVRTVFGRYIEHKTQNVYSFKPWKYSNTHALHRPGIYHKLYKLEDYFFKLSQWDEKYFNNLFNLTFFNTFEWPLLLRTKIQLEQLKGLYDAFDPYSSLESTEFLPTNAGIYRGDTETDYQIQQRVNNYWTTVIKKRDDDFHNDIGFFVDRFMPLWSYVFGFYFPLIIVGAVFLDTFTFHTFFIDFLPPLATYIYSMFKDIDMDFSTWAIYDPWFLVNPVMGPFITREFISIKPTINFAGENFHHWFLFNTDIPNNYHLALYIYSCPSIDHYPFLDIYSKWEYSYRFYDVNPLTERMYELPIPNKFPYTYLPLGFDLFHILREFKKEQFVLMPVIYEVFYFVMFYIIGFLPRFGVVIPLALLLFIFVLPYYILMMRLLDKTSFVLEEHLYQVKKAKKYYNGLFSKK